MNEETIKTVDELFLEKKDVISKIKRLIKFYKSADIKKKLKEPIVFLMKNNGYTEILEGIRPGPFTINTPETQKQINLTPDKITTLKYGGQYWKAWIVHEDNASPFPQDPIHTAEMFRKTTQKLSLNWRDKEDAEMMKAKGKMWFLILGGIALLIILLISNKDIASLISGGGQGTAQVTKEAVKTVVQNATIGMRI